MRSRNGGGARLQAENEAPWLVYGTGAAAREVIAHAAAKGLPVRIAGRDQTRLDALATEFHVSSVMFPVEAFAARHVHGVRGVINAAGSFGATAVPLMAGCVELGLDYLDLSNEWSTHEEAWARENVAKNAGCALVPGAGFGTLVAEAVALHMREAIGEIQNLTLVVVRPPASPAAEKSLARVLEGPSFRVENKKIVESHGRDSAPFHLGDEYSVAHEIADGDLMALHKTAMATNIRVYVARVGTQASAASVPTVNIARGDRAFRRALCLEANGRSGTMTCLVRVASAMRLAADAITAVACEIERSERTGVFTPCQILGSKFVFDRDDIAVTPIESCFTK